MTRAGTCHDPLTGDEEARNTSLYKSRWGDRLGSDDRRGKEGVGANASWVPTELFSVSTHHDTSVGSGRARDNVKTPFTPERSLVGGRERVVCSVVRGSHYRYHSTSVRDRRTTFR